MRLRRLFSTVLFVHAGIGPACARLAAKGQEAVQEAPIEDETGSNYTDVLIALYRETNGSSWVNKNNWLTGNPCAGGSNSGEWHGIECDDDGVQSIIMEQNNLVGKLPSELGTLANVNQLVLDHNSLSGPIPSEIGYLSVLGQFELSYNDLRDRIPSELGMLTKVSDPFNLQYNGLNSSIPTELGLLESLTANFDLGYNSLTGTAPTELGSLVKMQFWFFLESNGLNRRIPTQLGRMNQMTRAFATDKNGFSGPIPTQLGMMTGLSIKLDLYSNDLTNSIPSQLGQLTMLTEDFALEDNTLCGAIPSEVAALSTPSFALWNIEAGNALGTPCCRVIPTNESCTRKSGEDEPAWWQRQLLWAVVGPVLFVLALACCCFRQPLARLWGRDTASNSKRLLDGNARGEGERKLSVRATVVIQKTAAAKNPMMPRRSNEVEMAAADDADSWEGDEEEGPRMSEIVSEKFTEHLETTQQLLQAFLIPFEALHIESKPLAAGGSGQVYRGKFSGMDVAIKSVFRQMIDVTQLDDVMHEAMMLAQLHHPHFVRLFGICRHRSTIYIVTEFVPYTLDVVLARKDFDAHTLCCLVDQMIDAIHFIHSVQICHRDLKPQNILIDESMQVKVCDLGMSKVFTGGTIMTQTVGVGTPQYMPPEVLLSRSDEAGIGADFQRAVGGPTWDIYSLGVLLWELWYRERPFAQMHIIEVVYSVVKDSSRPPFDPARPIPGPLRELIERMWHQSPQMRPTAEEVRESWVTLVRPTVLETTSTGGEETSASAPAQVHDPEGSGTGDGAHEEDGHEEGGHEESGVIATKGGEEEEEGPVMEEGDGGRQGYSTSTSASSPSPAAAGGGGGFPPVTGAGE